GRLPSIEFGPCVKSVVCADAVHPVLAARVSVIVTPFVVVPVGLRTAGAAGSPNGTSAVVNCVPWLFSTRLPRWNGLAAVYGVLITNVPACTFTSNGCGSGANSGAVAVTVTPVLSALGLYSAGLAGVNAAVIVCAVVSV